MYCDMPHHRDKPELNLWFVYGSAVLLQVCWKLLSGSYDLLWFRLQFGLLATICLKYVICVGFVREVTYLTLHLTNLASALLYHWRHRPR